MLTSLKIFLCYAFFEIKDWVAILTKNCLVLIKFSNTKSANSGLTHGTVNWLLCNVVANITRDEWLNNLAKNSCCFIFGNKPIRAKQVRVRKLMFVTKEIISLITHMVLCWVMIATVNVSVFKFLALVKTLLIKHKLLWTIRTFRFKLT